MGITKNGSSLRFGGNIKSNKIQHELVFGQTRPAHLQCGWNSNFYQTKGHISGKLLLNWCFSAWKIHQHWKKISLWAYPECLIVQTIQNTIRNYYMLQNSYFFTFFDTLLIHFLFQIVLLFFFSVQQLTIVRISKFCSKIISPCYILNKWIMIQYSNKASFSLKLVKNWYLGTSFTYLNQIFTDLEDQRRI